jgi:hypothetical protein
VPDAYAATIPKMIVSPALPDAGAPVAHEVAAEPANSSAAATMAMPIHVFMTDPVPMTQPVITRQARNAGLFDFDH